MHNVLKVLVAATALSFLAGACAVDEEQGLTEVVPAEQAEQGDGTNAAEPDGGSVNSSEEPPASTDAPGEAKASTGSGDGAADPAALELARAVQAATTSRGMRGELRYEGSLMGVADLGGQSLSLTFETADNGDAAMKLSAQMSAFMLDLTEVPDANIEIRMVGADGYLGVPVASFAESGLQIAGETAWLALGAQDAEEVLGVCEPVMGAGSAQEPLADQSCSPVESLLSGFDFDSVSAASIEGVEDVRGVETRRVRLVVPLGPDGDPSEVLEPQTAPDGEVFEDDELRLIIELWVDEGGLAHRLAVDLSAMFASMWTAFGGDAPTGETPTMRIVVEIFEYGDFTVVPPPADSLLPAGTTLGEWARLQELEPWLPDDDAPPVSSIPA